MSLLCSLSMASFFRGYVPETVRLKYKDEQMIAVHFKRRSGYLFSGTLDLYDDGGEYKLVIRNYQGEWAGTVVFADMRSDGLRCFDMQRNSIIKTLYQLKDEEYVVYVKVGEDEYVMMHMELCPGDEEILERVLAG